MCVHCESLKWVHQHASFHIAWVHYIKTAAAAANSDITVTIPFLTAMRGFMTSSGNPDCPRSARVLLKDFVNVSPQAQRIRPELGFQCHSAFHSHYVQGLFSGWIVFTCALSEWYARITAWVQPCIRIAWAAAPCTNADAAMGARL